MYKEYIHDTSSIDSSDFVPNQIWHKVSRMHQVFEHWYLTLHKKHEKLVVTDVLKDKTFVYIYIYIYIYVCVFVYLCEALDHLRSLCLS